MISWLKDLVCARIPERDRKEFSDSINAINVSRAKLTSLLFAFLEVPFISFLTLTYKKDLLASPQICYFLMYCLMLLTMLVFYVAFRRLESNVPAYNAEINVMGIVFTVFILCWCAGISTLDQISSGQIMVYAFAVIAVSVTPYFKPLVLLGMILPIHIAFVLRLIAVSSSKIPLGNISNSTTFVIIGWAISALRFRDMLIRFGSQKLIERKNEELSRLNRELQDANEKLFILSHVDGLTGIANRSAFDEAIRSEWNRCMRLSLPLTLFMVDIDFFKGYNDHYGHQAGDECLRRVAVLLSSFARRKSDTAARYGGEEFVLILPYMTKAEAEPFSGHIVRGVEELKIPYGFSSVSSFVTISLGGCTVVPGDGNSIETLIGHADQALYEAKKRRNNAVMFSE